MQDTKSVAVGLPAELVYINQYFSKPIALHATMPVSWLAYSTD
jgi:hypothetical protein